MRWLLALVAVLKRLRPPLSLEVGTYRGGSLQVLSRFSQQVMSIDIDPEAAHRLTGRFENVEFRTGDSQALLPKVVQEINRSGADLGFVLIDGNHSASGIRRDIDALLELVPRTAVVMLMHDSFNPDCRTGMKSASWELCPYVHFVELDLVPGVFIAGTVDTAAPRTMWGGFACAVLLPEKRSGSLAVQESQEEMHGAVKRISSHIPTSRWHGLRERIRTICR